MKTFVLVPENAYVFDPKAGHVLDAFGSPMVSYDQIVDELNMLRGYLLQAKEALGETNTNQ